MDKKQLNSPTKITKVTLVIYCCLALASLIAFIIASCLTKNFSYLYGFLLCLGPGLVFVFVSMLLSMTRLMDAKLGKAMIAWFIIAYILKYGLIIGIPFIGIKFPDLFNRWVMLGTTLVGPVLIIISKSIFANYVSKNSKTSEK